ncbi:tape measure protein [Cohnella silvisoli]|uniref:Tape measure protein n=1 Tax=Cohnella silvisoli TaxID=2873699 RepID=A0ABV1L3K6_9BACL|nr:tape measure protein [Cohnella silvisoli]MCD9025746.1 tape measure protein [Cohnella silvisoli]
MDKFLDQVRKRGETLSRMKMTPAARLNDRVTEPARKATASLRALDKAKASPSARLIDRVSSATKKINGSLRAMSSKAWNVTIRAKDMTVGTIGAIKNRLFSLPGMLGMGAGVLGGVVAPLNLSGQMEQANIAFETMLGSANKAKSLLADLQNFANKTPFEFPELRDSSKRLLAFGFQAKRIIPMMTSVGNASAGLGLGGEGINRITMALGQMKAKSKVSAEEMMQLTEAGIPAWDILAKKMGLTTAQTMKLSERGLIPANQAIDALLEGMNDRFPNMMQKQSRSLFGLGSNIKDTFNSKILMRWGDGIRTGIQSRLEKLADWIDKNDDTIKRWGNNLERMAGQATDWIARKFEKVFSLFDDPKFQNADFFKKMRIVWDELITDPFSEWWSSGGEGKLNNIASKMGEAIGGTLGGLIMGAFGLAAGETSADQSPFVKAGASAGTAFLESFLESFDAGKIAKKAADSFKDVSVNAIKNPTPENLSKVAIEAGIAIFLGKKLGVFKGLKGLLRGGKWLLGAGAAASGGAGAAAAAAEGTAAAAASRVLIKGNPASPYAKGWNPRYQTPVRPGSPLPWVAAPGIAAAARFSIFGAAGLGFAGSMGFLANNWEKAQTDPRSIYSNPVLTGRPDQRPTSSLQVSKNGSLQLVETNAGKVTAVPPPTLTPAEVDKIAKYLTSNTSKSPTQINVQVPANAVSIQVQKDNEIDYSELEKRIGSAFVARIKVTMENRD